ncbi:MAG: LysE family transporter [Eubacteriales bacterium]
MFYYIFQGLLLGLAYVAPIGMQNLYIINTAAKGNKAKTGIVLLSTIFFDITLALACFFGIGITITKFPILKGIILILGSLTVIYIGITLLISAPNESNYNTYNDNNCGSNAIIIPSKNWIPKIITTCFVVTWLNPQAIIDGSLLLGGFYAFLPENMTKYFIFGVCIASLIWFSSLVALVSLFGKFFNSKIIRILNIICGLVIIFYGAKLGYSFIKMVLFKYL